VWTDAEKLYWQLDDVQSFIAAIRVAAPNIDDYSSLSAFRVHVERLAKVENKVQYLNGKLARQANQHRQQQQQQVGSCSFVLAHVHSLHAFPSLLPL